MNTDRKQVNRKYTIMKKYALLPIVGLLFATFNNEAYAQQSVYRQAIKSGRNIRIHGWVYDFSSGKVKVLTPEIGIGPREHCDFQALKKQGKDERH